MSIITIDVKTKKQSKREWTKKEIEAHDFSVKNDADNKTYIENRLRAYPDIGDQLDALWKELNIRQMNGEPLQTKEARDMLGQILQIKEDYPKTKQ